MEKNYLSPNLEVIEMEIQDAILVDSVVDPDKDTAPDLGDGTVIGGKNELL